MSAVSGTFIFLKRYGKCLWGVVAKMSTASRIFRECSTAKSNLGRKRHFSSAKCGNMCFRLFPEEKCYFFKKEKKEPKMRERPWEEQNFVFANRPFWQIRSWAYVQIVDWCFFLKNGIFYEINICGKRPYLVLQFEVAAWPLLSNEQKVIEQKQIPLLGLDALKEIK